jgi:hypothetical protein
MFEIWNEPNNEVFWQPDPNPAAYTADFVAAYRAIKAVDPSASVISTGLAPLATQGGNYNPIDFLKAMYADGARGNFDALGYHAYSYPALPDNYEPWSGWSQMAQASPSVRSVMTSHDDGAKPIWITEVGAPSGGPGGVGQEEQAVDLTSHRHSQGTQLDRGALRVHMAGPRNQREYQQGLVRPSQRGRAAEASVRGDPRKAGVVIDEDPRSAAYLNCTGDG